MHRAHVLIAAALTAGAVACGPSEPDAPPSLAELTAKAGCAGGEVHEEMFAREATTCSMGGRQVSVATFDARNYRDAWTGMLRGTGYPVKQGALWAVSGTDQGAVEAFADAVD